MADKRNRYKQMEWYMTYALVANLGLFLLYLVFSAFAITWLKVILAILVFLISAACLAYLYLSQELLRRRSLWMSAAAAAVLLCLLVSLLCNYPRPNPFKTEVPDKASTSDIAE